MRDLSQGPTSPVQAVGNSHLSYWGSQWMKRGECNFLILVCIRPAFCRDAYLNWERARGRRNRPEGYTTLAMRVVNVLPTVLDLQYLKSSVMDGGQTRV
jgi:hypothetical protein